MHKMLSARSVIFSLLILFLFSCRQKNDRPGRDAASLTSFLDAVRQTYELPALSVSIVHNEDVYTYSSGVRSTMTNSRVTDQTKFFTGNISELIVCTAILRLASKGQLSVDDPVVKHLPYFHLGDSTYRDITIRHLLTQTSGIPKHSATWDAPSVTDHPLEATTRSIALQQHESLPGTRVKRSQYNYDILADVVEKTSGVAFENFLSKEVFPALGMTSAAITIDPYSGNIALPHNVTNWLTVSRQPVNLYPTNPEHAGSIGFHATAKDLNEWMKFVLFNTNDFLQKDLHDEFISPQFRTGTKSAVGMGWEISDVNTSQFSKNHNIGGFTADLQLLPDDKIGVCVLSNTNENFNPSFVTHAVINWLNGDSFPEVKKPVGFAMGNTFAKTSSIDSALTTFTTLEQQRDNRYDLSQEALSDFALTLIHRLHLYDEGISVYEFIDRNFPASRNNAINKAEAYLLKDSIDIAQKLLHDIDKNNIDTETAAHLAYLTEALQTKMEQRNYGYSSIGEMSE